MFYSTVYWVFMFSSWAYVIYKYKIWLSLEMICGSRKKFAKSWIIIEMTKFDAFIHITHITFIYLFIYLLLLFLFAHKIFIFIVVFTCWFLFIVFMNNFSIVILRHSLPYIHLLWLDFCILNCNKFYHWLAHERKIAFCRKVYCFYYSIWPLFVIFFFSLFHPISYMFNISVIVIEQYVDEHTHKKKKIMAHTRKFIIFIVIIIAIS